MVSGQGTRLEAALLSIGGGDGAAVAEVKGWGRWLRFLKAPGLFFTHSASAATTT